jgi:sugar lactone lactonase YvrE
MSDTPVEVALAVGAQHPEGPLWDAESGRLWWVDITGQAVHSFDPATGLDRSWSAPAQPGGVLLDSAGEVLVASPEGLAALDQDTGTMLLRVPIERDKPENRANDVKVDARGRAWVGTMAFNKRPGNAALYRVEGDEVTCVVTGLTISNGPAFDEASGRLYLADTDRCIVDVFDLDPVTGGATRRRRFLDFTDDQVWPDGMTVDDAGMFWVALGRAGAVHRYRPDGTLDGRVELPTSNPTSVAFGGPDRGTLYITTSWSDVEPDRRAAQPLAGAIFRCRPGVTGPPSPRYRPAPSAAARNGGRRDSTDVTKGDIP